MGGRGRRPRGKVEGLAESDAFGEVGPDHSLATAAPCMVHDVWTGERQKLGANVPSKPHTAVHARPGTRPP